MWLWRYEADDGGVGNGGGGQVEIFGGGVKGEINGRHRYDHW